MKPKVFVIYSKHAAHINGREGEKTMNRKREINYTELNGNIF